MIKVGMMIGDRYEILEKIGTGGMSDVYKAKCHKLNRFVAVKVLKQEFSENANFVSKFRIEAQAAAGLMHPNIVNVYDVGEENGIYYIVMELVEGITLKRYIEKKARLSYKEAVSIAIQVSMGIEAAHNNHIIHRDIKPQNIIISREGKVKVTDFGIAKAATSNTITSNVMGSVHYTSPEQARGGYSDEKSDIYSLGITLFEMLTGRVPFNGETTVAIAIKHIQEEMPSPKEFVPEVPGSVEGIVAKCCQKSPDRRYQNMRELIDDLKQSLMNPDYDFVTRSGPAFDGTTRMISEQERAQIKRQTGYQVQEQYAQEQYAQSQYEQEDQEWQEELSGEEELNRQQTGRIRQASQGIQAARGRQTAQSRQSPQDNQAMQRRAEQKKQRAEQTRESMRLRRDTEYLNDDETDDDEYDYDPRVERVTTVLAVITGLIICGIIIFLLFRVFDVFGNDNNKDPGPIISSTDETEESSSTVVPSSTEKESQEDESRKVEMPMIVGWNEGDARRALLKISFKVEIEYEENDEIAKGVVISADREAGEMVPEKSLITLLVSSGPAGIEIVDTAGRTRADAENMLTEQGFEVQWVETFSETVAPGIVISQNPAGGSFVPEGSVITVTVSRGSSVNTVMVPNVINMTEQEGTAALEAAGLIIKSISYENHSQIPEGRICYQSYSYGSYVELHTTIDLHISIGPASYSYHGNITAPTSQEAPDYEPGSEVNILIVANNGQQLYNSTVSSFPQPVNFYGIKSEGATVTLTYSATSDGVTQQKSFSRQLQFEKE